MVMCAPDCDCKWCRLHAMAEHPRFCSSVDKMLDEFKPYFVTALDRQMQRLTRLDAEFPFRIKMQRLTGLEAQVPLHVDDEPAVPEPGLAPDALHVLGDEVELAAGVCEQEGAHF